MRKRVKTAAALRAPFLKRIALLPDKARAGEFPFTLPFLATGEFAVEFTAPVSFLVGENATGKSTLLEAIAAHCGFALTGGSRDHHGDDAAAYDALDQALRFSWLPRVTQGFFLRAESFLGLTQMLDAYSTGAYGGRALARQSHGEAMFNLIADRFGDSRPSLYLMDEPESAFSPVRQLAFLDILRRHAEGGRAQYIIATHSPLLMALPGATVFLFGEGVVREVGFTATPHFQLLARFFDDPDAYLRRFFAADLAR
jgi:predicted ATPase